MTASEGDGEWRTKSHHLSVVSLQHLRLTRKGVQRLLIQSSCLTHRAANRYVILKIHVTKGIVLQPPASSTITVVTQPPPVVMTTSFGESPVNIMCPNCRNQVTTVTEYESGSLMWILVLVLCLLGLWPYVIHLSLFIVVHILMSFIIRCCLIPFCVDGCKDVTHSCPDCKSRLGIYRRM